MLPNAWDVPTARMFEDLGFPAVATSSTALNASLGYPDGESIPRTEFLQAIHRIARSLTVPLSADILAGFGRSPAEVADTVRSVIEAGAVGVNLEDLDPVTDKLFPISEQVAKVRAIRDLAESVGFSVVLNARTDALYFAPGTPSERMEEAIRRASAYRDAGADAVYPRGLAKAEEIATFVPRLKCPVNVQIRKGLPPLEELQRLGIRRVSFGPYASYASLGLLRRAAEELNGQGTYLTLIEGAIDYETINRLAVPKAHSGP